MASIVDALAKSQNWPVFENNAPMFSAGYGQCQCPYSTFCESIIVHIAPNNEKHKGGHAWRRKSLRTGPAARSPS
ncbi:MAG: hypothetical protein WAV26_06570, partial [Candidatus Deferrimicrobium sp.]